MGGHEGSDQSGQQLSSELQKYPAFNHKPRRTGIFESDPLSNGEMDPALGVMRTASGHTLKSEGGSSLASPLSEGVEFPPAAAVSDDQ